MALASRAGETRVVLDNVSWSTFEALLAETGPRRGRFAYETKSLTRVANDFRAWVRENVRKGPRAEG